MDSNNGHKPGAHKPALAFKQPSNEIPIIGQPFTIKGWMPDESADSTEGVLHG